MEINKINYNHVPAIVGISGEKLLPEERDLFLKYPPFGFILFRRNCRNPDQVKALVDSLRELYPFEYRHSVAILIDQEGGRVQRLPWCNLPSVGSLKTQADINQHVASIAQMLLPLGINVNALPLLDLRLPGQDPIIGDRAFTGSPLHVAKMGQWMIDAHINNGLIPIMKHIPGHGRATCDSHLELPVVTDDLATLKQTDFIPFKLCHSQMAMTAHIVYTALDQRPATFSKIVIDTVIRDWMGFGGILLSDDLGMKALSGDMAFRARCALDAGCDIVLHCSGDFAEMQDVLKIGGGYINAV